MKCDFCLKEVFTYDHYGNCGTRGIIPITGEHIESVISKEQKWLQPEVNETDLVCIYSPEFLRQT
jgi:hypothetical protein